MTPFNVFRRDITLKRPVGGGSIYDAAGFAVEPSYTETIIRASVQPVTGTQLQTLPENRRDIETLMLYSDSALTTDDHVVINGVEYEVHRREAWQNNVINHNAYMVQKVMA